MEGDGKGEEREPKFTHSSGNQNGDKNKDKGNVVEPTHLNLHIKYLTHVGNYELIC